MSPKAAPDYAGLAAWARARVSRAAAPRPRPQRALPDYAGLRYYAKARTTGTHVGIYDGLEADMDTDGGRWQTVCEPHGSVISHQTLKLARDHAPHPEEWCEFCNGSRTREEQQMQMSLDEALTVVEKVDAHLDSHASPDYQAQPLAQRWARVTKVCEEAGEVWKELSKSTGENPRKGVCATEEDLLGELGDTVSAALCAIQHLTKNRDRTWAVASAALEKASGRITS